MWIGVKELGEWGVTLVGKMTLAAIISKPLKAELGKVVPELCAWIEARGWSCVLDEESAAYVPGVAGVVRGTLPAHQPDLVVVLGGDGTLLAAARAFAHTGTPLLSVNLGSLGFLTEVPLSDLYATLEAWCDGTGAVEVRSMMRAELMCASKGAVTRRWDALNDVVVAKGTIARMADFAVEIDGQPVAAFRADGVILSTPTGSTAYNLAADGPIVMPTVNCMVVTPICPHLLTIRPIVVPGEASIRVRVIGVPNETYLTVDGQEAVPMHVGDEVQCRRSEASVRLLRLKPNGLFNVLRSKLKWGER
ncbi:MAG TPA: NAD(+)/NADH kinase [Acidobacteriaceae bacterium]|nr:NAD(+)/NADH kinase [Acidobacteriaceae bacterium]